ncbi:MAG: hypothetical protein CSA76_00155 [Spirochaetales bacterium]|nr:MAG: hypothetical protein CSA76_00155 [Spirochaetales bacterium]
MHYTYQWPVTTDGSHSDGRATVPFLCTLFQETATYHADKLGWGFTPLKAAGLQWSLSRQRLEIEKIPRWKDIITIETWPSNIGGITWTREYKILNSDNEVLGNASSLWFLMDRKSRRPVPAARAADVSYLTWILNALDADFLQSHQIRELEINFMAEGFIGQELTVLEEKTQKNSPGRLYALIRSDNVEMCRLKVNWESLK